MKLVKRLALVISMFGVMALPFTSASAATVSIESSTNAANQTAGATQYQKTVTAKVDDVVKVQVWYHNREEADSGLVANNLKVQVNLPSTTGTATVTGTASSDNSNTVATTTTVNMPAGAHLEYIPGTAYWRHNTGDNTNVTYVTQKISDSVVTAGGVVLENLKPCFNFEATVTVEARVVQNQVSITKQVRKLGDTTWQTNIDANAGDTVQYLITFKNEGNTELQHVIVGDNLPPHESYLAGTTMLKNSANPNGIKISNDNVANGGIDVGNYTPGANGYVWFNVQIDPTQPAGCNVLQNVGLVRPQGMNEIFNTATVKVCVNTPTPPVTPPTIPTPSSPVLPQTGMEGAAGGMVGTGALGYAVHTWRRSKQSLASALRKLGR